jgi:hypothetical protein
LANSWSARLFVLAIGVVPLFGHQHSVPS